MYYDENRVKSTFIGRKTFLEILKGNVKLKNPEVIPEYTKICEVHEFDFKRGFSILLMHPSFPECSPGQIPEEIKLEYVPLTNEEKIKRKLTFT